MSMTQICELFFQGLFHKIFSRNVHLQYLSFNVIYWNVMYGNRSTCLLVSHFMTMTSSLSPSSGQLTSSTLTVHCWIWASSYQGGFGVLYHAVCLNLFSICHKLCPWSGHISKNRVSIYLDCAIQYSYLA